MKPIKLLALFLALLTLVTALTACPSAKKDDDGTTESETSTEEETTTGEPKIQAEELHIIEKVTDPTHEYKATGKGKDGNTYGTDYQIVYAAIMPATEFAFVKQLRENIKSATGVMIPLKVDEEFDDEPDTLRQDKEIIVGAKTNRKNEYTESFDYQKGYSIFVSYDRLVILTGSSYGCQCAVNDFFHDQFGQDPRTETVTKLDSSAWTVKSTYQKDLLCTSASLPELGAEIKDYKIAFEGVENLVKRTAYSMQDQIYSISHVTVPVSLNDPSAADDAKEFVLTPDDSVAGGAYKIEVAKTGYRITVRASDYYGFEAAARYFGSDINSIGYYPDLVPGAVIEGNYLQSLHTYETAAQYAYDKAGDVRVMFSNVLFGDSSSTDDGSQSWKTPTGDRNLLQIETYKIYQPDVLGCQEFNNSKRDGARLYSGETDRVVSLPALLKEIGYEEAVDPRVHNSVPGNIAAEYTVSDPVLGNVRYYPEDGMGKMTLTDPVFGELTYTSYMVMDGGGSSVSLDGGTTSFPTYYNNTPLFYNTKTTELLAGAYYWYQNHLDGQLCWANDCGSKAMTWGLFKDKATEKQYIVISTHMCTRSATVKALEAMEVIDYVEALAVKYPNTPMFLGGDMNGTLTGGYNIRIFMERLDYDDEKVKTELLQKEPDDRCVRKYSDVMLEKYRDHIDFIDVQCYGMGGVERALQFNNESVKFDPENSNGMIFVSTVSTGHGYPDYNKLRGMIPDQSIGGYTTDCIDRIFMINGGNCKLNVFGVITDVYSRCSSDHSPIFVDFDFVNEPQ